VRHLALVALLLGGCDRAFGLTGRVPPDAPSDAPPDVEGDSDGDTLVDDADNCPAISNLDQHDEDRDGVGDVCDNCPHVANTSQDNTDQDSLGEACDDSPATDCLVHFDPFTTPLPPISVRGAWGMDGVDSFAQTDPAAINAYIVADPAMRSDPLIITRARVKTLGNPDDYNNLGLWAEASVATTTPGVPDTGFVAEPARTTVVLPSDPTRAGMHVSRHASATMVSDDQLVRFSPGQTMMATSTIDLRLDMRGASALRTAARLDSGAELVIVSTITPLPAGRVGFRTYNLAAAFDYLVIIERRSGVPCPPRD
jgi:hypothetical protein